MKRNSEEAVWGSLAGHPDFRRALAEGRVPPRVRLPPPLALPFLGKPEKVFERQVAGLSARLAAIRCSRVVVGISGGLDSALALIVAHAAFARSGFAMDGIFAYTMPGFGTTDRTKGNAHRLCRGLGISLETIGIVPACRRHFKDIGQAPGKRDVTFENAQARMRTLILMDKANQLGGIVLGTGDMSEIALGWSTYNGDHMSMFAVNAGVPKTVVREVCAWRARAWMATDDEALAEAARALKGIVETPVSPELVPGQVTENVIGPYELHDFFLQEFVGRNRAVAAIRASAVRRFAGRYSGATIDKTLATFCRRLVSQAFKRNCAPDGVKIYRDAYFSPEDWHCPSDLPPSVLGV